MKQGFFLKGENFVFAIKDQDKWKGLSGSYRQRMKMDNGQVVNLPQPFEYSWFIPTQKRGQCPTTVRPLVVKILDLKIYGANLMKKIHILNSPERKDYEINLCRLLIFSFLVFESCIQDQDLISPAPIGQEIVETPVPAPVTQSPVVIVKTDETISTSGKNDIEVIRNYFFSGTVNNDNLTNSPEQPLWPVELEYANDIGAHGLRSINGARNCNLDENGNFLPTGNLKTHLNVIHNHNWDLHLVVGQSKPKILAGNAWEWDTQQWDAYEDYAYKCLEFVMNEYRGGFQKSIIEVSNEVDISGKGGYWFVEGIWNNGDLKAYQGYIKCYAQWSDAVKRFTKDYPGKQIKLFGPAITAFTIWWTPLWSKENWALKFIGDCRTNNWRLDGITFHQYGAEMLGQRADYSNGKNPCFASSIKEIKDKLNQNGFAGSEIWITEWGCSSWVGTERYKNNYRPVGGAFAAAFMHDAVDNGIDGIVPLRLRDPNSENDWSEIGSLATINHVIYPKPIYNVFKMFNQLPGSRKKVEWKNTEAQLGAIASASQDQIGVIVYNYDWDDIKIVDRCQPHPVQIKITGKKMTGNVLIKRFLMDSQHSNLAKYVDAGQLPPASDCQLQQVEEYRTAAMNDTVTLATTSMEPSSVSLWLIRPD
ncbi:MAG: hypothetical protein AB2L20_03460 [Mangrovibacterium sp.]